MHPFRTTPSRFSANPADEPALVMKITFVLPRLMPRPTGGGKIVYQYANALAEAGHEVEVLHPRTLFLWRFRNTPAARLRSLAADCAKLMGVDRAMAGQGHRACVPWMKMHPRVKISVVPALYPRYVPHADVIVATLWRTAEYVERLPARSGEKFYFIQHHETWAGPEARVNRTLQSRMKKIVISGWLKDLVHELSGDTAWQVPNPVDHAEFFLTSAPAQRARTVSMLYSPHAWKGAAEGVAALELAKASFPDLQAVLFGTAARPDFLPAWIAYVQDPARQVLRETIYNASSIYLCPSWSEGWGLPALEAMACGCAVVTADNGGTRDFVIDGQNGIVVPPKSAQPLADALVALLGDDARRTAYADRSVRLAQQFTLQASVERLVDALSQRSPAVAS